MSGLPGIETIRSTSRFGLSVVYVFFEEGMDIYFARRLVLERLPQAREMIPAGFGTPEDTNKRFKYLLAQAKSSTAANTGLSTAFDLPTLMGRDSDDPLCVGEVGRCGVAIDTMRQLEAQLMMRNYEGFIR